MLEGAAKRYYQRIYMRKSRAAKRERLEQEVEMGKIDYTRDKARTSGLASFRADREAGYGPPTGFRSSAKACAKQLETLAKIVDSPEGFEILKMIGEERGYQPGWAVHRFKERFGHLPWCEGVKVARLPPPDLPWDTTVTVCLPGARTRAPYKIDKAGKRLP